MKTSTPEEVLADPSASFWLKDALRTALQRDPVDAANEAEVLADVLHVHMRRTLDAHGRLYTQREET